MISMALALLMTFSALTAALPAAAAPVYIEVDGVPTGIRCTAGEDGELAAPVSAVAHALGAQGSAWDADSCALTVWAPGLTLTARLEDRYMEANGRYFYVPGGVGLRRGLVTAPLAALAAAFGARLDYTPGERTARLSSGTAPIEPGEEFYDPTDLYWMSRIIEAEAGGEPFEGRIAVGNVVMARVAHPGYPDTVKGVIFDTVGGVQFTPAYSGSIDNDPSELSVIAAKLALEGCTVVHALFFASRRAAATCWASRTRPRVLELGGHVFFK